jgi:hypothetical protein
MGYTYGEKSSPWFHSSAQSFDGSDYIMICSSVENIGKIEKQDSGEKKQTSFLRLTILFAFLYSGLYLLSRNGGWPSLFENVDQQYFSAILIGIPLALQGFQHWFNLSSGTIKIYLKNSDPQTVPCSSYDISTAKNIIGLVLLLAIGCLIVRDGGELYCDLFLLLLILHGIMNYFFERPLHNPELVQEDESMTPLLDLHTFHHKAQGLKNEVDLLKRSDIALLTLLQGNESAHLEFKASTWTPYNRTTDELSPVDDKTKKYDVLQDEVISTVAAFLNSGGGTLLIGVQDKPVTWKDKPANVLGIEPDFPKLTKSRQDIEGYRHALLQMFTNAYSRKSVVSSNINIQFPEFENNIVCKIDVTPVKKEKGMQVYTNVKEVTEHGKSELFFARLDDTTVNMSNPSQISYIRDHFEHPYRQP